MALIDSDTIPFIFGGNAEAPTLEELKRRRAIAAAIAASKKGFPKTLGEGLTYFGESLGEAVRDWRDRQAEERFKQGDRAIQTGAPPATTPAAPGSSTRGPGSSTRGPGAVPAPRPVPTDKAVLTDPALIMPDSDPALASGQFNPVEGSIMSYSGEGPSTVKNVAPVYNADSAAPAPVTMAPSPTQYPIEQATIAEDQSSIAPPYQQAALPEIPGAAKDALRAELLAKNNTVVRDRIAQALVSPQHEANRAGAMTDQAALPPIQQAAYTPPEPPAQAPAPAPVAQTAADIPFEGPMDDPRKVAWEKAISGIESGGSRNPYGEVGVPTKGGRALGKFQVMSDEIGDRTEASLGYRMTPQEFLNNPNAQHTQFRQQFGDAVAKYGEEGAARNWYGGDRGMYNLGATDAHGRLTVRSYGEDFMRKLQAALGSPQDGPAPAQARAPAAPQGPPVTTLAVRPSPLMDEQPAVPQQAAAPATPEDTAQDRLLREVALGAGRPSLLGRGATASRGDVQNDAAPLGRLGTIGSASPSLDADVAARRNAITDTLLNQQQQQPPAPAVPDPDPTVAGPTTVPASPTTGSERPVQLAQAGQLDPSMFNPAPLSGSTIAPAPGPRTPNDRITKPPGTPQDDGSDLIAPHPGDPPIEPQRTPLSPREAYWRNAMRSPQASETTRQYAADQAALLEKERAWTDEKNWARYVDQRERWQAAELKHQETSREAPMKNLERKIKFADEANQPAIAGKLREELAKMQRENSPDYVQREREKAIADLAEKQRQATKPDTLAAGGTQFERPYAPPGTPQQPYAVPPGAPQPKKEEMTADQAHAQEFVQRVRPDLHLLDNELQMGKALTVPAERLRDVPLIGNLTASDAYRRSKAAMNNFEGGFMQRTSGAAVNPSEAARNLPAYLPAVGDTARDLADKSARRHRFVDAVEASSGQQGQAAIRAALQESSDHLYARQLEKPPVRVSKPGDELILPPGQRFISPDGRELTVPRRRIGGGL